MLDSRPVVAHTCIHHMDTSRPIPMLPTPSAAEPGRKSSADQRLRPGTRLTEEDLSAVFGVSRTIVRQALTQLAAHSIVGVRPKKGWFIIEPPEHEVRDVFAARRLVESALIREFAASATPAQASRRTRTKA